MPPHVLELLKADRLAEEGLKGLLKFVAERAAISPGPIGVAEAFKDLYTRQLWLVLFLWRRSFCFVFKI